MKLLIASTIAAALIASPALSQPASTTSQTTTTTKQPTTTTKVKTTTKTAHVEGTVTKPKHHVVKRHHVVRCGCPSHAYKVHHKTVTKTTTTTKS